RYRFNSSRNSEVVWWSHMSPRLRRRYLGVHLFCLLLQGAAEARRGQLRPWLSGKLAAMRMGRQIHRKRLTDARLARLDDTALLNRLERRWFAIHVTPKIGRIVSSFKFRVSSNSTRDT